jgi:hypothetical protein
MGIQGTQILQFSELYLARAIIGTIFLVTLEGYKEFDSYITILLNLNYLSLKPYYTLILYLYFI